MKISFIIPSRNNLKYLKWCYAAIRKNLNSGHEVCVADDFSNDGTWEWCQEQMAADKNFRAIRNNGPTRLGHTILYDRLINEVATKDIVMIWHADMYAIPGMDADIERLIKPKTIVSITRIEPPLHPPGPEKIVLQGAPTEPELFNEQQFMEIYNTQIVPKFKGKLTSGIFAPWALYKKDFQAVGGHDPLYAPQSKEDSDIFNRFILAGYETIQTWDSFVYHMTCRGSRFNPTLTTPGKNSDEWVAQNIRSTKNFIRKWGHFVKHDELLKPIVPHKYKIGFIVHNCNMPILQALEPWCDKIWIDNFNTLAKQYINSEQSNTKFNLSERVCDITDSTPNELVDITLEFDAKLMNQDGFKTIQSLSDIITESGEVGEFMLGNFKVKINSLTTYEHELIKINTPWNKDNVKSKQKVK